MAEKKLGCHVRVAQKKLISEILTGQWFFSIYLTSTLGKCKNFQKKRSSQGGGGGHLVLPYEFTNSAFTRFTVTSKKFQKHILFWLGFCTQNSYNIGAFADNIFQVITQYLAKILGGGSGFFWVRTWVADTYIPKRPRTKKIFGFGCTLAHSLIVGEYLEKNSIDES